MLATATSLFALAAFVAALVDVLPPLGPYLPGQIAVLGLAFASEQAGISWAWIALGAFFGAVAGDLVNFRLGAVEAPRGGLHAKWVGSSASVGTMEFWLQGSPVLTVLGGRFFTRTRALLPLVAGAEAGSLAKFVPVALASCAVWSLVFVGLGAWVAARVPTLALGAVLAATFFVMGAAVAWSALGGKSPRGEAA